MDLDRVRKAEDVVDKAFRKSAGFVNDETEQALADASYLMSEVRHFRWSWAEAAEAGQARFKAGLSSTVEEGVKQVRSASIDRLVTFLTA